LSRILNLRRLTGDPHLNFPVNELTLTVPARTIDLIIKDVQSGRLGAIAVILPHRPAPVCRSTVENRAGALWGAGAGPLGLLAGRVART
jgi:hypothetical protein